MKPACKAIITSLLLCIIVFSWSICSRTWLGVASLMAAFCNDKAWIVIYHMGVHFFSVQNFPQKKLNYYQRWDILSFDMIKFRLWCQCNFVSVYLAVNLVICVCESDYCLKSRHPYNVKVILYICQIRRGYIWWCKISKIPCSPDDIRTHVFSVVIQSPFL